MSKPSGLARQHALWLAIAFLLVELVAAAALLRFLMWPLAERSADDLAALLTLSAQTWVELPPATRADFEEELFLNHRIALRAEPPLAATPAWRPPFFGLLEAALAHRSGIRDNPLVREVHGDEAWYWISLPAGAGRLTVGVAESRIATRPGAALLTMLLGGLGLAVIAAIWLARRITRPLARLARATAQVGVGDALPEIPETGPRELAELAASFNAMARQVRDLLAARTTLLAGVSHDLRTPLARMRLGLEMLRSAPDAQLLARLEADIDEMNGLIATLLDLARGLEHEPAEPVELAEWLHALAADWSTPPHPVDVRCPPCRQNIPPRALRRALGNLLENARRYAPAGPIELTCEPGRDECVLSVLDRGPGIPPERIAAMFEPFSRLDASRSPRTGGAGLGLAIVRELARANGWRVALAPRPEGGLAARIALPASGRPAGAPPT